MRCKKLVSVIGLFTVWAGVYVPVMAEENGWEVSAGLAVGAVPVYEGSGSYSAIAFPYINAEWRETVSVGLTGVDVKLLKDDKFKAGVGLRYDGGREEDGDVLFGGKGDDRLMGLGDIDDSVGARLFAYYDLEWVSVGAEATRYFGNDNDGTLLTAGIGKKLFLSRQLFVSPRLEATWANTGYMETFFGVTPVQSERSGFSRYENDSGVKDIALNVSTFYQFSEQWYLLVNVGAKRLLNSAADSPISEDDTTLSLFSVIGYRF